MPRFETEVGLPVKNPRYTEDGKHGSEFPPVEAHWGFWQQAMSMSCNSLSECGDYIHGWVQSNLIWREIPKHYSLDDPLVVETPGFRFVSHDSKKTQANLEDFQQITTPAQQDGSTTNSGFTGFTENAEPVLFNQQPASLTADGVQIPNSSVVFKNPNFGQKN
jgi:hypothetical protein